MSKNDKEDEFKAIQNMIKVAQKSNSFLTLLLHMYVHHRGLKSCIITLLRNSLQNLLMSHITATYLFLSS